MTAKAGALFLLKDGTGTGATTIAAQKTTGFKLNGKEVDVTNKDSAGYQELLAGAGITDMEVSAAGILQIGTAHDLLVTRCATKTIDAYTLAFGGNDKIEASFQITSFEVGGDHDKEQTFSMTLKSSGSLTFTGTAT